VVQKVGPVNRGRPKKDGKQLATDVQDVKKKITELAKGLSKQKIAEAEAKQKQLTELRDRKARLSDLGITIRDTLKFVDDNLAGFNTGIAKINQIAGDVKLGGPFPPLQYPLSQELNAFIAIVRDELRKTIGEIQAFQKDLDEKERGIKEHAKLHDKKKELEKSIQALKEKFAFLEGRKRLLTEEIEMRDESFRPLLAKRIEQRNKYLAIIAAFAGSKNDILNDLEFTAEPIFDRERHRPRVVALYVTETCFSNPRALM
jgi:septal ring factor EnvC (AmiA/AmiB activator)